MPGTQPINIPWDHITSLVVALTGLIAALTALWKVAAAKTAAEHASDKSDTNARAIVGMQSQITAVALQTPPVTGPVVPVKFVPPNGDPK